MFNFLSFMLESLIYGTKISVLGFDYHNYLSSEHCSESKRHIIARNEAFRAVFIPDQTRRVVPCVCVQAFRVG